MHSSTRKSLRIACALLVGVLFPICCHAWIHCTTSRLSLQCSPQRLQHQKSTPSYQKTFDRFATSSQLSVATTADSLSTNSDDDDDEEDEEYEYVEYDILTESEFMGSEWLVGTVSDGNPNKIAETWVRLATDKDGKNVAIWGDNSQGTWAFDVANQFLSFSKEQFWGKDIWAGVVDDYYYTQGTVRGWNFFSAAAVKGQWQARRLGVDPDEAGTAPWFEQEEDDDENEADESVEESAVNTAKVEQDDSDEVSATSTNEDSTSSKA
jgi:hypothetical protein